ncbi:hypothetical protein GCM10010306_091500 [Streptomyces umbrinus]|nr:hypothetical protein GCM10010306_091500 [Streptomyces umbrinus]
MSKASVSALVNTLERDGLASKVRAPYNGRAVQPALTDTGLEAITTAFSGPTTSANRSGPARSAQKSNACSSTCWQAGRSLGPLRRLAPVLTGGKTLIPGKPSAARAAAVRGDDLPRDERGVVGGEERHDT